MFVVLVGFNDCCVLCIVNCVLFAVVCCVSLFVVCLLLRLGFFCQLYVVRCVLCVVCCLQCAVCGLQCVGMCCVWFAVYSVLLVVC